MKTHTETKNWIQKATKNMRKDKPCTGEKFGSESCPPGSKRYNLAKTFRKMAKEGHKLASLEKASVLSASDDPKDQDKAREIRVRHDYESLKKQISSKEKPTKPAVKEEVVDEDTKRTTKGRWVDKKGRSHKFSVSTHTGDETHVSSIVKSQYPAKRVVITGQSADKKKKAAKKKGKKIKESVECDCKGCGQDPCVKCGESHHNVNETTMPNIGSNDKKAIKSRAKNLFKKDLKGQHDSVNETVSGGVPMTPQELEIQKKMSRLNMRLARKRNQEMQKAKVQDTETAPEQVKEDKAFELVRDKLKKKYGSGVLTTGEKPKDTRSEKSKTKATRKRAASDEKERRFKKRNPAVTSGRYPKDDEKAWAAAREREKREGVS